MKLHQVIVAVQLPLLIGAYNPFKSTGHESVSNEVQIEHATSLRLNQNELIDSRTRKPDIYTKAMLELRKLQNKPICYRLAVQLLLNNCQGLEDIPEEASEWKKDQYSDHQIQSSALSLTMCDLEMGKFVIPNECSSFGSLSLYQVVGEGKGKLEVSTTQVEQCLEALAPDTSLWLTWLGSRDKTLMFCRAARFDIDKDQQIENQKKFIEVFHLFANDLEEEFMKHKDNLAEHYRTTESHVEGMKTYLQHIQVELKSSLKSVSTEILNTASVVKSSLGSAVDLDRVLRNFVQTVIRGNAEMAAVQEQSVATTANLATSQIETLKDMAGETEASIKKLNEVVLHLVPVLVSLQERQNNIDQKMEGLHSNIDYLNDLLQNHTQNLERASSTAHGIHSSLENAAAAAESFNQNLGMGGSYRDYAICVSAALASVFVGNYNLAGSLSRNVVLFLGGLGVGESIVQLGHLDWAWLSISKSPAATTFTHLPREQDMRSLATTPVEIVASQETTTNFSP